MTTPSFIERHGLRRGYSSAIVFFLALGAIVGLILLLPLAVAIYLRQRRNLPTMPLGLRLTLTATRVLILGQTVNWYHVRVISQSGGAGATSTGYVPKTAALKTLRAALETVAAGGLHIPLEAGLPLKPAANGN